MPQTERAQMRHRILCCHVSLGSRTAVALSGTSNTIDRLFDNDLFTWTKSNEVREREGERNVVHVLPIYNTRIINNAHYILTHYLPISAHVSIIWMMYGRDICLHTWNSLMYIICRRDKETSIHPKLLAFIFTLYFYFIALTH